MPKGCRRATPLLRGNSDVIAPGMSGNFTRMVPSSSTSSTGYLNLNTPHFSLSCFFIASRDLYQPSVYSICLSNATASSAMPGSSEDTASRKNGKDFSFREISLEMSLSTCEWMPRCLSLTKRMFLVTKRIAFSSNRSNSDTEPGLIKISWSMKHCAART